MFLSLVVGGYGKGMTAYNFVVRTLPGPRDIESGLRALSQEGWEPINFSRDSNGEYEKILRREALEERAEAVLEYLEATTDIVTPSLQE